MKPSQTNVLISAAGIAQICDYGLDPVISLPDVQVNVTPGSVTCSHWIAPEFIGSNPKQKTKSADVFAFAMLAVEVYTGELPFKVTPASFACIMIFHGHRPGRPQAKPFGFTEGMWKFIQRCWNQEPIERPSIDEVVNTWEGFVKGCVVLPFRPPKNQYLHLIVPVTLRCPQPKVDFGPASAYYRAIC